MSIEEHTYPYLIRNAYHQLIGEIEPSFRGVAVDWKNNTVNIYFYIEGEISETLHEHCSVISSEIISCFSTALLEEHILRVDYPKQLPSHKYWLFLKKEHSKYEMHSYHGYEGNDLKIIFALLGEILPTFRGIAQENIGSKIKLVTYVDGPLDSQVKECCDSIKNKIQRLMPVVKIEQFICRVDFPDKLPNHEFNWVYKRKEYETLR